MCAAGVGLAPAQTGDAPLNGEAKPAPEANTKAEAAADTEAIEVELAGDRLFEIPAGATKLLDSATLDPEAWHFVSAKRDSKLGDTWQLRAGSGEPLLECTGQPFGLLRTKAEFANYRFGLQWRFVDDQAGNSGLLLHAGSEKTVWPRAVQVQFHSPELGALAPVGGATVDLVERRADVKARPAGQWNSCIVSSKDGSLTVKINGSEVGAVTGCDPRAGGLGFQSEGAAVQFRRIWVLPEQAVNRDTETGASSEATTPAVDAAPNRSDNGSNVRNAVDVGWHRSGDRGDLRAGVETLGS